MTQQPHFFQTFFGPGAQNIQNTSQQSEYILHNEALLEISNNWPYARWTMDRYRHKDLHQVDPMEQFWVEFIVKNNIDVENYKNNEEFLDALWKDPPI